MGVLDGKVALITGAGTGIGQATAWLFAEQGARVVIAARREEKLRETVSKYPDSISLVKMDLDVSEDRRNALKTAQDRHGRLDILVNNAANQYNGPFLEMSEDDIAGVFHTNLTCTMCMIQAAVPYLRETRGNIVNITSTAGRFSGMPPQLLSAYSSSRGGMNQMTRALATELGQFGIRVNAIAPGLTRGEVSNRDLLSKPDAPIALLESLCPLGRIGEPTDIAKSVLFMASDQADWVTGQILDSSGGFLIGGG
jgi:NAD(P)-dependent dehydrogenase (short-subunit alcohol dehydrogenase family)